MIDLPDPLDEQFPLGDGTAAVAADAACPYCGEWVTVSLDPGGGSHQTYVEDCPICCRPWAVVARWDAEGGATVELSRESGE